MTRRSRSSRNLMFVWTVVYAANLIVPLGIAWTTFEHGHIGIVFALGLCWLIGLAVCIQRRAFAIRMVAGGKVVALTQIIPILQVFAGGFAINIWDTIGRYFFEAANHGELYYAVDRFFVTILTGAQLLAVAAFIGWVVRRYLPDQEAKMPSPIID